MSTLTLHKMTGIKHRQCKGVQIGLLCLLWVGFTACQNNQEAEKPPPPNILWITSEDTSPVFGCYGDPQAATPNIDQIASEGVVYTNAYASAPICAPARSCLISGLYATSLGTQHLRSDIPVPDFVRGLPAYLSDAGYFTFLYGKTDYNFDPKDMWDDREQQLTPWRNRKKDQPFFGMYTIGETHEGGANIEEKYREAVADLPDSLLHDPENAQLPAYFPDTPAFRKIWSDYYDLVSDFDLTVGNIIQGLKEDGLYDNTIIFIFSDHGFGLPRYKRWLYKTGLQVPLIVRIPPQYQHLAKQEPGSNNSELVSFVDFAPTVLNLAAIPVPDYMEGQSFLGQHLPRKYVYGARSRADNMYEVSRAVLDSQYIYIRHYFPHYPYIQPGYIFSDRKRSFRELRRLKEQDLLTGEALDMWLPKGVEELYDLRHDPQELHNLAEDPRYQPVKTNMQQTLHAWMKKYHDTGLLLEPEMMIRAEGATPYHMAHDPEQYDVSRVLEAAEMVGKADIQEMIRKLKDQDSGVRYWAVIALQAREATSAAAKLTPLLDDPSPTVQIAAAETLCRWGQCAIALPILSQWVQDDRPWLALQAARSIELIGAKAKPLVPVLYAVLEKNAAPEEASGRYKDFNFAAFTSWSLEWALHHCGEDIDILRVDMI